MAVAAPSGVVTFLFTDIEGSTRRWEADAGAMRTALAVHDELLGDVVTAHGGWLFKHTGDGVCAAFGSPLAAVDAAVAAQLGLALPVRMGIATGEAELRGEDYFGAVLNRAARVMAAGHGGQILLDGATAELLTGVELVGLGPRRLRDIARPVNIFQVLGDGLHTDFPPLRTVDSTPGNLRPATTTLVGRDSEVADVHAAITTHRSVTLTGPGGVGKTRLALEVAARTAHEFPDGVWLIELAPVGDPAAVPETVAAVLGITQQPGTTVADSVAAALAGRSRLLVFDNCEHVLDAAAEIIDKIVAATETVTILATSREGLRLPDEQLWPVPSLDVNSSAARLFVERASAVAPGITRDADADVVVDICRRLDGIPLAIELAASRMQSMSAVELRDRLDDRFRLLTGSRRGLARHQTLRQAVKWSFDLLDAREKGIVTRCSVFAGGFDLSAAHAVADSGDELEVLDLLDALVRKSLLIADRSSGRTRYSMLETIRQFAEEQLVDSDESSDARDAHARYFASLEDDVLALWDGARQRDAYEWLGRELPNLRSAFRWAFDSGDLDTAAAIAFYCALLGIGCEQYEPVNWSEELVAPAQASNHPRLVQLCVMAAQCYVIGRVDDAIGYVEIGEEALRRGCLADVPFGFEAALGTSYHLKGAPEKTAALARLAIARNPAAVLPRALLVMALANTGASDEAMATAESMLADANMTDNPLIKSMALTAYSWAFSDAEPAAAHDVGLRAMEIAHGSGNRFVESTIHVCLSRLAVLYGDAIAAFEYLARVIRDYRDSGSFILLSGPLGMTATLLQRLGREEPAATITGFGDVRIAHSFFTEVASAIASLRESLGAETYESLAQTGARMSPPEMVSFALDEIDRAVDDVLSVEKAP